MSSYPGELALSKNVASIVETVARAYQLTPDAIFGRDRHKCVAEARHVAMFLTRAMTSLSYPEMGRAFERDHSTVIHAVQRVRVDSVGDAHLFDMVERLREEVLQEWALRAA